MWIPLQLLNMVSASVISESKWRVLSWVCVVVLCCASVTAGQGHSLDISNMVAYTGKLFYVSFESHPVYGSPNVSIQLSVMSESADDQFPAWLLFNNTSRTLSGVPMPNDEGGTRLTITATCNHISENTKSPTVECCQSLDVFELTVSTFSWANSLASSFSVANPGVEVSAQVSSLGYEFRTSPPLVGDAGCEGARVVASLVLCCTSEQLTSRERLDLMSRLSDFLAIPVSSITLESSSTRVLKAVENGFQMISAGSSLDDSCNLNQNIEVLWWLPCSTIHHLNDFIRVLQHNVDGGRLHKEVGRPVVGWYIASSNSLLTRESRRRRGAGYRTVVPTPVLSPLQPTAVVVSAQLDTALISSLHLPTQSVTAVSSSLHLPAQSVTVLRPSIHLPTQSVTTVSSSIHLPTQSLWFSEDYTVTFPDPSSQIEPVIFSSAVVSSPSTLLPGYRTENSHIPMLSGSLSSTDLISSSSLISTQITSSQILAELSPTAQLWESNYVPTAQFKTDSTFSYSSIHRLGEAILLASVSPPDLPTSHDHLTSDDISSNDHVTSDISSYDHVTSDNSSNDSVTSDTSSQITTKYQHELNATRTSLHPFMQSSVGKAISLTAPVISQKTASQVFIFSQAPSAGTSVSANAPVVSSLLYPSSSSFDWLQESGTETSTSIIQDVFLFDDIQTRSPSRQMSFPESSATSTQEVWFWSPQMSDYFTLMTPSAIVSFDPTYLVTSRCVEVIATLFTSIESAFTVDSWVDLFPSISDSTSMTSDTAHYYTGSNLRSKYNTSASIDTVWNTGVHEYSDIQIPPSNDNFGEQSQELGQSDLTRSLSLSHPLAHSTQIPTDSLDSAVFVLHPLYASHNPDPASATVTDWGLLERSSEVEEMGSIMAELDLSDVALLNSITSPAGDSSNTIMTSVSSADITISLDDHTTVAAAVIWSRARESRLTTTAAAVIWSRAREPRLNTTSAAANRTATTPASPPFFFLTSAATRRPRTRTTTPVVTRTRTTTAAATTTTTQRTLTSKRPALRKPTTQKVRPTSERTTPGWEDDLDRYPDHLNNRPYVQRSIKVLRADQGKLLEFSVPHDVFYDIEDGDTRHLSLSLELPSNQVLPDNFWLFFEPTQQVIKALPLLEDMDIKNMSVVLVARDKEGLAAADYITLQINDTPRRSFTHVFRMKFAVGFLQFMHSRRNITELLEKIGDYFGDNGAKLMTVLEVRQGSFMMSWTNNSLTGATCQTDVIRHLYSQMVRRDGTVRQAFSRQIGRHLHLKEVQLQPWGSCISAPSTTITISTTTTTESTSTHLVSEIKGHGFSIWAHVILPVLIAVLIFILIILIIIFCNRRRRQQQATLNAEKEAVSNDGNPIIFPSECEPEDVLSKERDPRVSPVADLQPTQNTSAGSSQVKNNLNRDQERAKKSRDNREQEWLNKDTLIHDQECDRDSSRNVHRKHTKESSSGRRYRDPDRTSRVSASSTLSWDRPNNHYLEEEAGSRSSTLKSTKSAGSDKRHCKSPPPYWQHQTDPPPYRMPPPYLSNNTIQM